MPLCFTCVVPHAGAAFPELVTDPSMGAETRITMAAIGAELAAAAPESLIILTPHGFTVRGALSIALTGRAAGTLGPVQVELEQDQALSQTIADLAGDLGLPVAPFWFGDGTLPLDWSSIVPLRFLGAGLRPLPRLVVIGTSSQVPREQLVTFGRMLRAVADASLRRIALVASVDQGHAHAVDGPYGYSPASADFDALLQTIVASGDLEQLLAIDEELEAAAMPDSLQAMLVLYGALQGRPFRSALRSYEVYHYFSGLCATFELDPASAP